MTDASRRKVALSWQPGVDWLGPGWSAAPLAGGTLADVDRSACWWGGIDAAGHPSGCAKDRGTSTRPRVISPAGADMI